MPKNIITIPEQNVAKELKKGLKGALTKIESGATPDPRIETVSKIASGLSVGVDDLLKQ